MIDLSGQTSIVTSYETDPDTGIMTVTFSDGVTELGSMQIEAVKFRSFVEAQLVAAKQFYGPLSSYTGQRTIFDLNGGVGTTVFG